MSARVALLRSRLRREREELEPTVASIPDLWQDALDRFDTFLEHAGST